MLSEKSSSIAGRWPCYAPCSRLFRRDLHKRSQPTRKSTPPAMFILHKAGFTFMSTSRDSGTNMALKDD